MSAFDQTKDQAGQKAEETKGFGQEKAGQAQDAAKVQLYSSPTDACSSSWICCYMV